MDMGMAHGFMLWGMDIVTLLMLLSGVFYLVCALLLFRKVYKGKDELMWALFAFLVYQAINMFFMGIEMKTHNMMYSNIAAFAVLMGSVYMLKFPMSSLSKNIRQVAFVFSTILVLGVFAYFMTSEALQMKLMNFTLWYDIFVNGIVVGGFMLALGLRAQEREVKIKALSGSSGVVSCCVAANGAMIAGSMLTSSFFAFLAPLFILRTLSFKEKMEANSVPPNENK